MLEILTLITALTTHAPAHARAINLIEPFLLEASVAPLRLGTTRGEATTREEAVTNTVKLMVVWSLHESSWHVDALGDKGSACGLFQFHGPRCEELREDPRAAAHAFLAEVRWYTRRCGGLAAGLGVLATGKCGGAPKLVARRCREAGVVCR